MAMLGSASGGLAMLDLVVCRYYYFLRFSDTTLHGCCISLQKCHVGSFHYTSASTIHHKCRNRSSFPVPASREHENARAKSQPNAKRHKDDSCTWNARMSHRSLLSSTSREAFRRRTLYCQEELSWSTRVVKPYSKKSVCMHSASSAVDRHPEPRRIPETVLARPGTMLCDISCFSRISGTVEADRSTRARAAIRHQATTFASTILGPESLGSLQTTANTADVVCAVTALDLIISTPNLQVHVEQYRFGHFSSLSNAPRA